MSEPQWRVVCGDALTVLKTLPSHSFSAMCTDPPAGVAMMAGYQSWDKFTGGGKSERDNCIAAMAEVFTEAKRVLKPGALSFVWALPRTSSWTARALEDSGFLVKEYFFHHHAQGMPKAQDASKAIDRMLGQKGTYGAAKSEAHEAQLGRGGRNPGVALVKKPWMDDPEQFDNLQREYIPTTEEAKQWQGWSTATKPTTEIWILAQAPLAESSLTRNLLEHGVGYLHVDACRVERAKDDVPGWHKSGAKGSDGYLESDTFKIRDMSAEEIQARCGDKGRYPPNLLLTHSDECEFQGYAEVAAAGGSVSGNEPSPQTSTTYSAPSDRKPFQAHGKNGKEQVECWCCAPGCPVGIINHQSGLGKSRKGKPRKSQAPGLGWGSTHTGSEYSDEGGASRFYPTFGFFPKPSRSEKEAGLEDLPERTLHRVNPGGLEAEKRFAPVQVKNFHSTVKGISLCRWLTKLICPVGGYILDPFSGSGSIGVAAVLEGFGYFGIDRESDYVTIARDRIAHWAKQREEQ